MSILSDISNFITSLLGKNDTETKTYQLFAEVTSIAETIDSTIKFLRSESATPSKISIYTHLHTNLTSPKGKSKYPTISSSYMSVIDAVRRVQPNRKPQEVILSVLDIIQSDLSLLYKNFKTIFSVAELSVEELKLSHALAIGYITQVRIFLTWVNDLTLITFLVTDGDKPAPYLIARCEKNTPSVIQISTSILLRPGNVNIISDITSIRNGVGDPKLSIGGITIDQHMDDSALNNRSITTLGFLTVSRYMDVYINIIRWLHERDLKIKEWMRSRSTLLIQELNGLDPNSEEYRRQSEIIEKYAIEIRKLDARIEQYEDL
jgi:hypothetical protein